MTQHLLPILLAFALLLGGCRRVEPPAPGASGALPTAAIGDISMPEAPLSPPALIELDGDEDADASMTISASEENENVVYIKNAAHYTLSDSDLNKLGDSYAPGGSGENACIRVLSGSTFALSGSTVTTGAAGAPALFLADEGSSASVVDTLLVTSGGSSPSVSVCGAGVVTLFDATLMAEGADSPCVLVENAAVTATAGSMHAVADAISRLNGNARLAIENADMGGRRGFVIAPDALGSAAAAALELMGGYLDVPADAPLFVLGQTQADVRMENVTVVNAPAALAQVDGGRLFLTLSSQSLSGRIQTQGEGTAQLWLTNGSQYTGAFPADGVPSVSLALDDTGVWQVTEESFLTVLTAPDTTFSGIQSNGHNVYYDSSQVDNVYLNARSYLLPGGGFLIPLI